MKKAKAAPPGPMHVCKNCLKDGTGFERCSKCKCVRYCSREGQHAHWKRSHKRDCGFTVEEAIAMQRSGGKFGIDGSKDGGGGGDGQGGPAYDEDYAEARRMADAMTGAANSSVPSEPKCRATSPDLDAEKWAYAPLTKPAAPST